jgi:hypothetical protein
MSANTRDELLGALKDLSNVCPEMRFGQLIINLATLANRASAEGLWDMEDDELLAAVRRQSAYFTEHRGDFPTATVAASPPAATSPPAPTR